MTPHLWTDPIGLLEDVYKTIEECIERMNMKISWMELKDRLSVKGAG